MLGFGKKSGKEVLAKEAKEILDSIDGEIIESALEAYAHIKTESEEYDHDYKPSFDIMKNTQKALRGLVENNGELAALKSSPELILALKDGHLAFNDVVHVLIDHHKDKEEALALFKRHPKLHKLIPKEYDDSDHLIEVLLEFIRDYQWQIEHFAMEHEAELAKY